jgi:site-specific DNA-cytosine methylase
MDPGHIPTVGSLCSGYGGLEYALRLAGWHFDLAWVADNDPAATKVLAHRHPGVPNLGDITAVDWAEVERVAILAAGFPCTNVSCAGRRAGIGEGTQSGVWSHVARAIDTLRPRLVVLENVPGLLSTPANRSVDEPGADRDLEPGSSDLGNPSGRPLLRAAGAVLGDLADLGFDAVWTVVSAASVGAPHLRRRVFVLAWPAADPPRVGHGNPWPEGGQELAAAAIGGAVRPDGLTLTLLPTPNATDGNGGPREVPPVRTSRGKDHGPRLRDVAPLLPTPTAADGDRVSATYVRGNPTLVGALLPTPAARVAGRGSGYGDQPGRPLSETVMRLLPTPAARLGDSRGTPNTETAERRMGEEGRRNLEDALALLPTPRVAAKRTSRGAIANSRSAPSLEQAVELAQGILPRELDSLDDAPPSWQTGGASALLPTPTVADSRGTRNATAGRSDGAEFNSGTTLSDVAYADRWGEYAPAIARWETILGRPAPDPTEPGRNGQPRLAARFAEWMHGLPDGYVTGPVDRNAALRLVGNGIVPLQGAAAVRQLVAIVTHLLAQENTE